MGKGSTFDVGPQLEFWGLNRRPPCFECGKLSAHDHHVIPRSQGGTKTVPLCEGCHGRIHHKDLRIRALTKDALRAKKERGERTGTAPLGYRLACDGKHVDRFRSDEHHLKGCKGCFNLEPDPHERAAMERVYDLTLAGKSLRQVGVILTDEGFKPRGRKWQYKTISRMLALKGFERPVKPVREPKPARPVKPPAPVRVLENLERDEPAEVLAEVLILRSHGWGYKAIASTLNRYGYHRPDGREFTRDVARDLVCQVDGRVRRHPFDGQCKTALP